MDDLRLILLCAGVGIIAGIYFWDRFESRRLSRRHIVRSMTDPEDEPDLVITARKDTEDDLSSELANLNSFLNASRHSLDTESGNQAGSLLSAESAPDDTTGRADSPEVTEESTEIDTDSVVTLYLVTTWNETFTGKRIMEVLPEVGFRFGEMDIFHYFGDGKTAAERPLFSLADMYEPGSFDIRDMENFSTRGLLLFTCLPTVMDGELIFESMLDVAGRLAGELDATILGTGHRPLDEDTIKRMKQHIREYGR